MPLPDPDKWSVDSSKKRPATVVGSVTTHTGLLDLNDPDAYHFQDVEIVVGLSRECRYGGMTRWDLPGYTVAQHSVYVMEEAIKLTGAHPEDVEREFKLAALLHDAAEAFIGDLQHPLKVALPEYSRIEDRLQGAIYRHYGVSEEMANHPFIKQADDIVFYRETRDVCFHLPHFAECREKATGPIIEPVDERRAARMFGYNLDKLLKD